MKPLLTFLFPLLLTAAQTICDALPADAVLGLVLCGSNVALEDLDRWRQQFAA